MQDLVAIAKVVKPRGLRGEIVADLLTDFPQRFEDLETVIGLSGDGHQVDLKIEGYWFQKHRIVIKFDGIDSVEQADELRDLELCVPETEAAQLDQGEFFDWQLEGCEVRTIEGENLGTVRRVMRTGGTEVLVVENTEREYLIPFAESICTEVDVDNKKIRVDPPEGLLEF